ncbi:MAG: hypothetical protein IPM38_03355 [Ignavibacteria bacterium]|nr:hypothetical protein [Ignavibacteria bacterium]
MRLHCNSVPEPYQFDSARFEYDVLRLVGDSYSTGELWSMDTNQVFIVNPLYQTFVRIMDMQATYYKDPNFVSSTIRGISNNEVYLSGLLIKEGQPGMKKWNGSYLEEYPIDLIFNKTTFINKSLIRSSSDMWLLCNNIIIRKQGSDFTTYELQDTISKMLFAFYDEAGIPSYVQSFVDIDTTNTIKIYKFYGTWQKVFESREHFFYYAYSEFSNNVCKRDISNVYLLNGSSFENFFSTDIIRLYRVQGFDGNNFMVNSFNSNGYFSLEWRKIQPGKFV